MAKETKKYGIDTKRDTATPVLPVSFGCHVSLNYTWMASGNDTSLVRCRVGRHVAVLLYRNSWRLWTGRSGTALEVDTR